jgi:ABC-type sugar transport system ATPase subunit
MKSNGLDVEQNRPVGELALAEQQLVEITKALLTEPRILLLDEPTSALQASEVERLMGVVRSLRSRGVGIVYVSHRLEEVLEIADRVTVIRDGRTVLDAVSKRMVSIPELVKAMVEYTHPAPSAVQERARREAGAEGESEALVIRQLDVKDRLADVSLTALPGEILGLVGLEGSGPRVLFEVLFGVAPADGGVIRMPGGRTAPRTIRHAVRRGVAFVPADRKGNLMLQKTIAENVVQVRSTGQARDGILLKRRTLDRRARALCGQLGVKMASVLQEVGGLSGGNQQKVVFAKWLDAEPSVVLLDDPTRGVDVGAKSEMYRVVRVMAAEGRVVLVYSTDLQEIVDLCDRALVFWKGRVVGELPGDELTEHRLLEAITTGTIPEEKAGAASPTT